ncbi:MAG: T9SS type A sorting domain-containing protein, partial [Saprospiraceae bacterium]
QTWKVPTKPVPNVNVALTGDVTATQVTGPPGTYLFSVPTGSTTIVTPTKTTAGNANITAADLLLIQNHIFGNALASPYQWVAANVNNSGGPNPITLADYLLIQRVVLGTDQHIQGSVDWKFIPKTYMFPTPNPLSVPFPTTISHAPANMDFLDDDFVAVRMGDVNGNIVPNFTNNESEDRSSETFRFRLEDRAFRAGEVITVPFKASDFTNRQAYQMTIDFNPAVFALENIGQGVLQLTDENFGTTHLSEGSLSTVWVGRDPLSLRDDDVLFTLTFRVLRSGQSLREVMHPGSDVTNAEAYDRDGKIMKIDFEFAQPANQSVESDFALYQNQPNPFQGQTKIGFRLPSTSRATLRVYNSNGRLVKTVVGDFEKGYNELNFRPEELGAAGVYWYELKTPTHSDRKKMILLQ